jgi:L-fucose mutarotase
VPVEAAHVMRPDDGDGPGAWIGYEAMLGSSLPLEPLGRFDFYETCRQPDLAICVATGDTRLYANLLLTVGYIQ